MPDILEDTINRILDCIPIESTSDTCDFTADEQNAALESHGIAPNKSFRPVLGETVTYIVACVIINDHDEVLMVQEAKEQYREKWYLPAGRMEKGESICEAACREVLEETGLKIETTTLLLVESAHGSWFRFTLAGRVIGGKLKTLQEADVESLQARWVRDTDSLALRASDIKRLIEKARAYQEARANNDTTWHEDTLPVTVPHQQNLLRLIICARGKSNVNILISEKEGRHLPTCEVHTGRSIYATLKKFLAELFGSDVPSHKPHGFLSIENDSKSNDHGCCFTMLLSLKPQVEEIPLISKCVWYETSKQLNVRLLMKITSRNSVIPLNVIK